MLYDPNWDQTNLALTRFIEWLRGKPADEAYNWMDPRGCACAQYFEGGDWMIQNRRLAADTGVNLNLLAYGADISQKRRIDDVRPLWTFGALLQRAVLKRTELTLARGHSQYQHA